VAGCGKQFAQFTALKTHRNVHTGSRPFKCGFSGCRSTFGDPSSCARHRREIHHNRDPFKCSFPGCTSKILRLSSFKTHLKKHGLDPDEYPGLPKRDNPFVEVWQLAEPQAMNEVQVSGLRDPTLNPDISLPDLPDAWDQFLSIPVNPSAPLVMQPGLTSEVSYSSPMVLAPSPRVAQTYNAGYFLSPPRPSPVSSSRYSSPMAPTPVLSPRIMPEFLGGIDVQSNPCSATGTTIQDWTASVWQGHGIQFVR